MCSIRRISGLPKPKSNGCSKLALTLEGALSGMHWQEVARLHRTSLLLALEEHEKSA